jgi:protein gp37
MRTYVRINAGYAEMESKRNALGRQQQNRVDRGDLEPGYGVLQDLPRVRALLRRDVRRALARHPGHPYEQGFALKLWPQRLEQPLKWSRPRMIFVNSMSDLFHEDIPDAYIEQVFEVMGRASQHTFQILTKRHERLVNLAPSLPWHPNIWMGVTIENRRFVRRADYLREVDAAVRW